MTSGMDPGTRICKKGCSLPGFGKTRPLERGPSALFETQEINFFFFTDEWTEKHWHRLIPCRILYEFVLRCLLKTEATYLASAGSTTFENPTCLVSQAMEATLPCTPATATYFLQVTAWAVLLVFSFPLQQNDEDNLEHMEAFPHCKLFWGGKTWFANSVKRKRH